MAKAGPALVAIHTIINGDAVQAVMMAAIRVPTNNVEK